jgi:hypothetical protein
MADAKEGRVMLDTLAHARHLERAGLERQLAEAYTEALDRHVMRRMAAGLEPNLDRYVADLVAAGVAKPLAEAHAGALEMYVVPALREGRGV